MAIDTKNLDLEKAVGSLAEKAKKDKKAVEAEMPKLPKEEEIAFHKGALSTLMSERNELIRVVANVEAIMSMHLKRLQELGVKIEVAKPTETKEAKK